MKRIAIVTIYGEENYGNRLQNYAVYRYLSEMGFACETIVIQKPQAWKTKLRKTVKRVLCETIVKNNEQNRNNSFSKFTKTYIPTRKIESAYDLGKLSQEYDFFVVGSDQVWNPCFGGFQNYFDEMFLTFAPREKRVCFSPSFGVSSIPAEWKKSFSDALDGFEEISVREKTGVKIVSELTGKTAICLPDPTLLFDADAWQKISREPKEDGFAFTYFLGERPEELLPKNGKIVDIMDKTSGAYYKYNPSDFIGFIKKADVVYTDSFHACVFAILFGKPFCVLERRDGYNSMSSRIQSLLEEFGEKYSPNEPRMIQIDPVTRDIALQERRKDTRRFMQKQLSTEAK
jgi:hypothetical protein